MAAIGIRAAFLNSTQDEAAVRQIYHELYNTERNASIQNSINYSNNNSNNPYNSMINDNGSDNNTLNDSDSDIKMLYITPEKLSKSDGLKNLLFTLYNADLLARFVIDEAHCVSQWGHDFRPDYLGLNQIRRLYPKVPIMALTATANQAVVKDSIALLQMRNPFLHTQVDIYIYNINDCVHTICLYKSYSIIFFYYSYYIIKNDFIILFYYIDISNIIIYS